MRGPGGDSKCVVLSDLMSAVWFLQLTLPQCGLKVRKLKNGALVSFLLSACVFLFVCLFGKEVNMIGQTGKTQGYMIAGLPIRTLLLLMVGNVQNCMYTQLEMHNISLSFWLLDDIRGCSY